VGWAQRYRVRLKIKGLERWDGGYVVFCGGEGREIGESEFNGRKRWLGCANGLAQALQGCFYLG
jgi:hypothetical protein